MALEIGTGERNNEEKMMIIRYSRTNESAAQQIRSLGFRVY